MIAFEVGGQFVVNPFVGVCLGTGLFLNFGVPINTKFVVINVLPCFMNWVRFVALLPELCVIYATFEFGAFGKCVDGGDGIQCTLS